MHAASTHRPIDTYPFEDTVRRAAWMWLADRIAALRAGYRARQTVRELAILDDRELRDVGLLRAEIDEAAARSAASRG